VTEVSITERVRDVVEPLLADRSLEVIDVELAGNQLRITVDRDGGVDLDAIAEATRLVSRALDEVDPIQSRYTLEVSSPGVERRLRTPAHFARATGELVSVKTTATAESPADERRITGTLIAANGATITVRDRDSGDERTIAYDDIERARTVFEWGPPPRPGKKKAKAQP
jgi:ribosome maturation factor RimP